ncbi:hypothetical protein Ancab_013371 [Ancistrocladus abbreviatus]
MDSCGKLARDSSISPFDCLLFDLDDTLYPSKIGIAAACKKNIEDFLIEKCGFSDSKASTLRVELFKTYGSTLAGLRVLGYDIDSDDYHSFVHGRLPYERIKRDSQLRNLLLSITQRKIIFTNSDRNHATKVLSRLGIEDCFDQIICFETLNPNLSKATRPDEIPVVLKPSLEAIKIAISVANVNPDRTLFLDDNVQNVAAGSALGLRTALVGKSSKSAKADYTLENIYNLAQIIPEIWNTTLKENDQMLGRSKSDIDTLLTAATVGA